MKTYGIGESDYGKLMDSAGRGKKVMSHRLYGHNIIYDFPIDEIENTIKFLEHEFSDLFTKQGLPIIPGEVLENTDLMKYCSRLTKNWNFVNGFDILSATISIYSNLKKLNTAINNENYISSIEELAKQLGIGSIEMAIAISTANPFLLLGAIISMSADIIKFATPGSLVFFNKLHSNIRVEYMINEVKIDKEFKNEKIDKDYCDVKFDRDFNNIKLN